MRNTLFAAMAVLSLGVASVAPALAGEGNGEPFDNNQTVLTTHSVRSAYSYANGARDVGSNQYPSAVGRAGTNVTALNNDVLPSNGSEGAVQTANSLPRSFENGTVAYAQAQSVRNWMVAHSGARQPQVAAR